MPKEKRFGVILCLVLRRGPRKRTQTGPRREERPQQQQLRSAQLAPHQGSRDLDLHISTACEPSKSFLEGPCALQLHYLDSFFRARVELGVSSPMPGILSIPGWQKLMSCRFVAAPTDPRDFSDPRDRMKSAFSCRLFVRLKAYNIDQRKRDARSNRALRVQSEMWHSVVMRSRFTMQFILEIEAIWTRLIILPHDNFSFLRWRTQPVGWTRGQVARGPARNAASYHIPASGLRLSGGGSW